jgi:hypothetical protein
VSLQPGARLGPYEIVAPLGSGGMGEVLLVGVADGLAAAHSDFNLYAVSTKNLGPSSTVPLPSRLFQACPGTALRNPPARGELFGYAFDTFDGQRFLINCRVQPGGTYRVLINSLMPR